MALIKNHRSVSISIAVITGLALILSGCATVEIVDPKMSKSELSEKMEVINGAGFDAVNSPPLSAGKNREVFTINMAADYFGDHWSVIYSSKENLGTEVELLSQGERVLARRKDHNIGGVTAMIYSFVVNEEFFKTALSSGRTLRIKGEREITFEISAALAEAFLDLASPLAEKWINPSEEFKDSLITKASSRITSSRDDYKQLIWVYGGEYRGNERNENYQLYARLERNGDVQIWIRVTSARTFNQGWAFYNSAVDKGGIEFPLIRKSEVGYGGSTFEALHIPLSRKYLDDKLSSGLDFKIYGERNSTTFQTPGWIIEAFLIALDKTSFE